MLPKVGLRLCFGFSVNSLLETTYLHTVNQGLVREVTVDERWSGSYGIQRKPNHQVFRTVWPIHGNHFSLPYSKIVHQPIAHSLEVVVELLVGPYAAFELEEDMTGLVLASPFFDVI